MVGLLACLVVWAVAVGGSLLVAAETSIGPVVVRLSQNHGIHLGDLAVVAAAVVAAASTTAVILGSVLPLCRGAVRAAGRSPAGGSGR